jgi:hypothetical protein
MLVLLVLELMALVIFDCLLPFMFPGLVLTGTFQLLTGQIPQSRFYPTSQPMVKSYLLNRLVGVWAISMGILLAIFQVKIIHFDIFNIVFMLLGFAFGIVIIFPRKV